MKKEARAVKLKQKSSRETLKLTIQSKRKRIIEQKLTGNEDLSTERTDLEVWGSKIWRNKREELRSFWTVGS